MILCTFHRESDSSEWECSRCGARAKPIYSEPPRARCKVGNTDDQTWRVVSRLTPHGLARLQLCKAAGCGQMVTENGVTRCGRLGKKCDGVVAWSAYLNGERWQCEHWPAAAEPAEPDAPQDPV